MRNFQYPATITAQKEGGFVVTFRDVPEAITQGETWEDAIHQAEDCLEEAVANRIVRRLDLPIASKATKGQAVVALPAATALTAALYSTLKERDLSQSGLAAKAGLDEKEIRRLLDPHHNSKLPRIEQVLEKMGKRLVIGVANRGRSAGAEQRPSKRAEL